MENVTQLESSKLDKSLNNSTKSEISTLEEQLDVTQLAGDGLDKHFKIRISADVITDKVNQEIASLIQKANLPGFRKFKSGANIPSAAMRVKERTIRSQYEESIRNDISKNEIIAKVDSIIKANNFSLIDNPNITIDHDAADKLDNPHDIVVDLKFTVLPEIQTPDFSQLALEKHIVRANDKEINQQLDDLYKIVSKYQDRTEQEKSAKGDKVIVDIIINGNDTKYTDENVELVLGNNKYIKALEKKLVGAIIGDKIKLKVTLPDDYYIKEVAGKKVDIHATIKKIQCPIYISSEEELLKAYQAASIDEIKQRIRENINSRFDSLSYMLLKAKLLNYLDESLTYDLPKPLFQVEYHMVKSNIEAALQDSNNNHVKSALLDDSEQEIESYCCFLAARRVRMKLFIAHYSDEKKIRVTLEDTQEALERYCVDNPQQTQMLLNLKEEDYKSLISDLIIELMEVKAIDHILNNEVKIIEKQSTADELQQLADAIGDEIKLLANNVSNNITTKLEEKEKVTATNLESDKQQD